MVGMTRSKVIFVDHFVGLTNVLGGLVFGVGQFLGLTEISL